MAAMSTCEDAQKVVEAHKGYVTRHDYGNLFWLGSRGVVPEPLAKGRLGEHIVAYGLHGMEDVTACEPWVCLYSLGHELLALGCCPEGCKASA